MQFIPALVPELGYTLKDSSCSPRDNIFVARCSLCQLSEADGGNCANNQSCKGNFVVLSIANFSLYITRAKTINVLNLLQQIRIFHPFRLVIFECALILGCKHKFP